VEALNLQTAYQQQALRTRDLSQQAKHQQTRFNFLTHAVRAHGQVAGTPTVGKSKQRAVAVSRWQTGQQLAALAENQQSAALSSYISSRNLEITRQSQAQGMLDQVPSYADVVLGSVLKTAIPLATQATTSSITAPDYEATPSAVNLPTQNQTTMQVVQPQQQQSRRKTLNLWE